jgi:3'(2'), 5'-bisphosphate nucleotidase
MRLSRARDVEVKQLSDKNMKILFVMIQAAVEAGTAVLEVYDSDFQVKEKRDHSPVTQADLRAHEVISSRLKKTGLPILSEEGRDLPFTERRSWETFFVVDPLDGTKEFVKRNGEFTINIACIHGQAPVSGVILVPVKNTLYFAAPDTGARRLAMSPEWTESLHRNPDQAFRDLLSKSSTLPLAPGPARPYTVVGSRSHNTPELQAFVEKCGREKGDVAFISAGSSLKFCLVAEGTADVYPRTGPTCEWDTAAGQAIAEHAGAVVEDFHTGQPLKYNKEDLHNPWFIVRRKSG